jgi:hypothetical protein
MSEFFTEWNGSKPRLEETTFSESEGWELCELFKRFYTLRESADMFYRSGSHVSSSVLKSISQNEKEDKIISDKINQVMIPKVTDRILEILTPKEEK